LSHVTHAYAAVQSALKAKLASMDVDSQMSAAVVQKLAAATVRHSCTSVCVGKPPGGRADAISLLARWFARTAARLPLTVASPPHLCR
jgi:hypothetical protein